jgi:hypothetical protein
MMTGASHSDRRPSTWTKHRWQFYRGRNGNIGRYKAIATPALWYLYFLTCVLFLCWPVKAFLLFVGIVVRRIDLAYGVVVLGNDRRAPIAVAIRANVREKLARIGGQHPHFMSGRLSCGQR